MFYEAINLVVTDPFAPYVATNGFDKRTVTFGDAEVTNPRSPSDTIWPWNIRILTTTAPESLPDDFDSAGYQIQIEVIGVPTTAPLVGQNFQLYMVFKNSGNELDAGSPPSDIVRVGWDIFNGPEATITVTDMYSSSYEVKQSSAAKSDSSQNWSSVSWLDEETPCVKINTSGCDMLTVKVQRGWPGYEKAEDLRLSGASY